MDDKLQDILDSLPEKPPRSRLEPYGGLIGELRRRGRTYREIAHILAEKCQLQTAASTIHDFVRVRSRVTKKQPKREPLAGPVARQRAVVPGARGLVPTRDKEPPLEELPKRIAALKKRVVPAKANPEQFHYDPNEPLHRPTKTRKA